MPNFKEEIATLNSPASESQGPAEEFGQPPASQRDITSSSDMFKSWEIARPWLLAHLPELEAAGWTKHLLFRAGRDKYPLGGWGPAWLHCWQQRGLEVKISNDGTLVFTWPRSERGFRTTAVQLPEDIRRKKMNRKDYVNLTQLKKRGWTIKLIEDFKPEHDATAPNPKNPAWAPQKLYDLEKIKEIESRPGFQGRKKWANWFQGHMKELIRQKKEAQSA
jgi:hypothetical protein